MGNFWNEERVKEYLQTYSGINVDHPYQIKQMDEFKKSKQNDLHKDWKVISFASKDYNWAPLMRNGDGTFGHYQSEEKDLLSSSVHRIESIQRWSDGKTIELGKTRVKDPNTNHEWVVSEISYNQSHDKIYLSGVWLNHVEIVTPKQPILTTEEGIEVYDPMQPIYVCLRHPFGSQFKQRFWACDCEDDADCVYFHSEVNRDAWLNNHTPKVPLFTTDDGVQIFEGDNYFCVDKHFRITGQSNGLAWYNPESGEKYFSTKEKRDEYITLNKSIQVSYKELNDYVKDRMKGTIFLTEHEVVQDFFKSKIN